IFAIQYWRYSASPWRWITRRAVTRSGVPGGGTSKLTRVRPLRNWRSPTKMRRRSPSDSSSVSASRLTMTASSGPLAAALQRLRGRRAPGRTATPQRGDSWRHLRAGGFVFLPAGEREAHLKDDGVEPTGTARFLPAVLCLQCRDRRE